jgi:hypothetical protein
MTYCRCCVIGKRCTTGRRPGLVGAETVRSRSTVIVTLIIEGVGASQSSVRPELDVIIWVETPQSARESRDASRIAAGETSAASYVRWMVEENTYMAAERPWEFADLIVDGRGGLDADQEKKIIFRVPNHPARGQHST